MDLDGLVLAAVVQKGIIQKEYYRKRYIPDGKLTGLVRIQEVE